MSPATKYTLGRIGLFALFAIPAVLLLPSGMNFLLKLMIALVLSAAVSYVALARWRDEMAEHIAGTARRRTAEKERLRAALAGEDAADPDAAVPDTADPADDPVARS